MPAEGGVVVCWDGSTWFAVDEPWFRLCRGYQYCRRYFIVDTIGM